MHLQNTKAFDIMCVETIIINMLIEQQRGGMKMKRIVAMIAGLCVILSISVMVYAWDDPYDDLTGEPSFYFYADTLQEVDEFLQEVDSELVANPFVTYNQLSFLGSFESFSCADGIPFEIKFYSYRLRFHQFDTQKYGIIQLAVNHKVSWNYDERFAVLDISNVEGSMAVIADSAVSDESSLSIIRRDELTYVYRGNVLENIEWSQNGMAFRLSYTIPRNEELPAGCFLDQLLSLNEKTFANAKKKLLAIGSCKLPDTGDNIMLPVFLLFLSAAAGVFALKKKRE